MYQLNDPYKKADLDASAARRQAFGFLSKPKEEQGAWWAEQEKTSAMRRRAKMAHISGRPAPRPRRRDADPPPPSRQYVTMATNVLRDPRLASTAAVLMGEICALSGRTGFTEVKNEALTKLINRSVSTIKRHLHDLEEDGYVDIKLIHNARGSVIGRRLTPTDKAWPFWHPKRQNPHEDSQPIIAPHITTPMKGESMETLEDPGIEISVENLSTDDLKTTRMALGCMAMTRELARTFRISKDEAVDHVIECIKAGYLTFTEHEDAPSFRLLPTEKARNEFGNGGPLPRPRRRRRLFRP